LASGGTIGNQNGETAVTHNYAAFFQDDWRGADRLTLNLGLRWDSFGPPSYPQSAVRPYQIFPGPNFEQSPRPKDGGDCGCRHDLKNFAPRVGFAFQWTPRTVVRSGFGIFYGAPDSISHDGTGRFYNQAPDFTEISFPTDRLF